MKPVIVVLVPVLSLSLSLAIMRFMYLCFNIYYIHMYAVCPLYPNYTLNIADVLFSEVLVDNNNADADVFFLGRMILVHSLASSSTSSSSSSTSASSSSRSLKFGSLHQTSYTSSSSSSSCATYAAEDDDVSEGWWWFFL